VVPYPTFTLDRGNHIIKLLFLIKERFPDILTEGSESNRCFHLLITKWTSEA